MSKNIKTRIQHKHDLEANWLRAPGFVPLKGELIIYDAETQDTFNTAYDVLSAELKDELGRTTPITHVRVKVGDGDRTVKELEFVDAHIIETISNIENSYATKDELLSNIDSLRTGGVYTATPETLEDVISSAHAGSTIQLTEGQYGLLKFVGKNSYPENLTIVGCDVATVAGVSITSGIISDTIASNCDISEAILAQGLTFKNIIFTGNFSQKNSRVDNLTIDSCIFTNGSNISILPESFVDTYSDERYSPAPDRGIGTIYRYPYMHVNQKNTTIKNCKIENSTATAWGGGATSAINVIGVEDITIYNNEVGGSLYNGISVGGQETADGHAIVSTGRISITRNKLSNSTSRAMNIFSIHNGEVIVAENTMDNANLNGKYSEAISVQNCKETTFTWSINGVYHQHNTYNGSAIFVNNGIEIYNTTEITNIFSNQPKTYIVSSPSKLVSVIAAAEAGATVRLTDGDYGLLELKGNESYPEDLTISGEEGVNIAGITITSGIRPEDGIQLDSVVMPKGLTLKNLTFTDNFTVLNSEISDLSIIDCRFNEDAAFICRASAFDAGGTRKGAKETMAHNVLVKNCVFDSSNTRQYGVWLQSVDGATFENNTIDGATANGILIASIYDNDKYSCGMFVARKNTISNTTSEGIKFWFLRNASVYVQDNILSSTSDTQGILANNCASTTITQAANTLNGEELTVIEQSVGSPADYIKRQIGLTAALNEKADKADLDSKMDESVLIYSGTNDADETDLNNWLENIVMPTMTDNTIRNISIRCGQIIPWPALGTIHKHANAYATIDVTTQVHGKHYTKVKNSTWLATTCETDKLNAKADKAAVDAALADKADKSDIENLGSDEMLKYEGYLDDNDPSTFNPLESGAYNWLDVKVLPTMEPGSSKKVSITIPTYVVPGFGDPVNEMVGVVYKGMPDYNGYYNVYLDLTSKERYKITAYKEGNKWSSLDFHTSEPLVYSITSESEEFLNGWLSNLIWNTPTNSLSHVSINCPEIVDDILIGSFYNIDKDNATVDLITQSTGEHYSKICLNGTWKKATKIESGSSSNAEIITNDPRSMTEKEVETWLEQDILPNMEDGSTRNILIRSSNLFDNYFGTKNDAIGVGTIYKRDSDYVVLDLVSIFSGRHITKVKSPDYPSYTDSDSGQGVWKNHMSITPYEYANAELECYTDEWDESKINNWLEGIGYDMTSNITSPSMMGYPTYIRNIEILHGPDDNRLIGVLYSHSLLDSDKTIHLTDYNTGKQYVKRRYMGVWEAMEEFGATEEENNYVTETQLQTALEGVPSYNYVMNYAVSQDQYNVEHDQKMDKTSKIFYQKSATDETELNAWLEQTIEDMWYHVDSVWIAGHIVISTPAVANGTFLMGTIYSSDPIYSSDNGYSIVIDLFARETGERYLKIKANDVWQNTVKIEAGSSGGITEEYLNEYLDEYNSSVLMRTYLNNDAFSHAHSDKLDCFPQIFTEKTSADETKLNTWLSNLADTLNSWSGGNTGTQNVYISTPSVASGQTLMGLMFLDGNNNATVNLTAVGTDERYIKVRQNGVWQNTTKIEAGSSDSVTETQLEEALNTKADAEALDAKVDKSLASYYSNNDTDETNFNAWLDARLSEMASGSVLGVKVNCYPAINGVTLFGMLYKHDTTNLYATLTLSTYAAGTFKKIKTNGTWLDTAALSDVAFTFTNGTLEIKTTF